MPKEFGLRITCDRCGEKKFFTDEDDKSAVNEWGVEMYRGNEIVLCPSCFGILNKLLDSYIESFKSGVLVYTSDGTPITLSIKSEGEKEEEIGCGR